MFSLTEKLKIQNFSWNERTELKFRAVSGFPSVSELSLEQIRRVKFLFRNHLECLICSPIFQCFE